MKMQELAIFFQKNKDKKYWKVRDLFIIQLNREVLHII